MLIEPPWISSRLYIVDLVVRGSFPSCCSPASKNMQKCHCHWVSYCVWSGKWKATFLVEFVKAFLVEFVKAFLVEFVKAFLPSELPLPLPLLLSPFPLTSKGLEGSEGRGSLKPSPLTTPFLWFQRPSPTPAPLSPFPLISNELGRSERVLFYKVAVGFLATSRWKKFTEKNSRRKESALGSVNFLLWDQNPQNEFPVNFFPKCLRIFWRRETQWFTND